ncbi:LysR family transcriptional regulator [Gymnodinialimonas ceratoperidinii]|uniref:LysR family transcriptional regulator n=1 Tax=Gymnodinialimonas ceratoperidinii TaxID=2856823 RepID=A0A8F6TU48_9RHOB|nr:LysR family transcriptional regulator [Gymnodinialimonas ceratoperidinii]QXT38209.1 LysR family transcriptional regulator [Gymnodinialimonas ceratoperidinii]
MKLQQLKYFAAVFENGSFSAAADKVNATQSGLSMHVSQIEKRYDITLFTRTSSGVTPTEAGRAFYEDAVKVLAAARLAEDRLRTLSKSVVGHVQVGLMPTFTRAVMPSVVLRFAEEYPNVRLSITEAYSSVLSQDVAEGNLDFAVVPTLLEASDVLLTKPMGQDRECLVCRPDRELPITDNKVKLRDLGPLKLVVPGRSNARRQSIEHYLMINNIEVAEILELDTMHGTLGIVANSEWVTILPGILCLPDLGGDRRKVVPLADPPLTVDYARIEPAKQPLSTAAQAFADILQEELNSALEMDLH